MTSPFPHIPFPPCPCCTTRIVFTGRAATDDPRYRDSKTDIPTLPHAAHSPRHHIPHDKTGLPTFTTARYPLDTIYTRRRAARLHAMRRLACRAVPPH
ncbi:hypothetical protein VTO73DRAFT_2578 [Trametes versicolor]